MRSAEGSGRGVPCPRPEGRHQCFLPLFPAPPIGSARPSPIAPCRSRRRPFAARFDSTPRAPSCARPAELDIATLPLLDNALRDLRDVGFRTLVVNLRGVTFIDSQGIQLLLRWTTTAARTGHVFRLVPGSERVQMVFAMTGVLGQFDFEDVECAA